MIRRQFLQIAADTLTASLKLAQAPVAVCFTDSVPPGVAAHAGHSPAGRRFWQDGATRIFAAPAVGHARCAIGVHTHNLEPDPAQERELTDALKVFGDLGYARPRDISLIPVLTTRSKHIVYAPLAQSPLDPSVVLLVLALANCVPAAFHPLRRHDVSAGRVPAIRGSANALKQDQQ